MAITPIRYRQPWTRQPQRPVGVDWSNPLSKGLIFAWTGSNSLINAAAESSQVSFVNGVYYFDTARPQGIVRKTSASGTIEQRFIGLRNILAYTPLTYGVAMRLVAYHPEGQYMLTNNAFANHTIRFNASLKIEGGIGFVPNAFVTSDNSYAAGDWVYVVMTARSGAWTMYVNGVKQSTVETGGLSYVDVNRVELNGSGLEFLTGFAAEGAWSEAQVRSWTQNPWQLFGRSASAYFFESSTLEPPRVTNTNTFYSPTVAAGAITLTPSRYDNTNTFYSGFVNINGVVLQPSLYTNGQTFYSPTVSSVSTSDNSSSSMSRGIFRGIERGVA